MSTPQADLSEKATAAAEDFFAQLYVFFETIFTRFFKNGYASIAQMSGKRWTKVIGSVVFYLIIRPYIEKAFKWMHDRDLRKEKEKREKEKANFGKVKVSPNSLRAGGDSGKGKVLGEVDNTDDELEDEEDVMAAASGVPEWNDMARKRQKNYIKRVKKDQRAEDLSRDQIMELLDWSDEEEVDEKVKKDL
ncbi:Protein trafficking Pga2 [Penicillium cf. griseofulvum]|uniref:Protein trafficking Pga2 n=1 Tax=Penicillium cf. griseofulvum TaxID=2972120 RepID=A0A9W9MGB6_9EURO|nr:Protein trafficking Pga2 [Penicillium cf. griseofulvum]KAJ5423221.1 Protein trafficking Pga2 [Penicillium cf. griseofulvum]KAJ5431507.1 Protein trafficking Pga2 [Penicillium cf. griseofulvum]